MIARYQKRISGPLLDRIDIHITVPRVEFEKLAGDRLGEPSAVIRKRVERAREIQRERFKDTTLQVNADMGPAEVRKFCELDEPGKQLMRAAMMTCQHAERDSIGNMRDDTSETDEYVSTRISPDFEIGAYDCGFSGE